MQASSTRRLHGFCAYREACGKVGPDSYAGQQHEKFVVKAWVLAT